MSRLRLVPPAWLLLAIGTAIFLHREWPVAQIVPAPWHWIALAFIVPAMALAFPSARAMVRRGTPVRPFAEPTALVTEGPFRYTRNPLYLGMAVLLAGVAIFLGSLTPFLTIPVFLLVIGVLFVRPEEAKLAAAFGEDYRQYCGRVRRWL